MADVPILGGFTPHDHAGRRDRLRARLAEWQAGALYVTGASNVRYLTGFTGSNGQVVVAADGTDLLLTDPRYEGRAAVEAPDVRTVITREPVTTALEHTAGRLGFEGQHLSYAGGMDVVSAAGQRHREIVDTHGAVEQLRTVKEASELERLRAACALTCAVFEDLLEHVRPGRSERELAVEIERAMVDRGAEGTAFDLIVASGPNGAIPHHEPTGRVLERDELVTFDIGARVDGYHADMTRTVAVGGASHRLRELHDVVRRAQAAGVAAAVAGATCGAVDEAAREILEAAGLGDAFVHGVGHGVGLDIHEAPIVTARPTATLEPSTVITVEPGVYLPATRRADGRGVRIEDTIVIAPDGAAESLTTVTRELITC